LTTTTKANREPGFPIPGILPTGNSVLATVAQWRQARAEAIYRDDMWSLQVFKAATVLLEQAERYGLADDDVLVRRLSEQGYAPAMRMWAERK
jgi:hypothetical protein